MAISATRGETINNATAGTSLVFSSGAATAGQTIVVGVSILTTSVSVLSITDTALNSYALQSSTNNSSNVRIEMWAATGISASASNIITVTFSGATLASAAYEEYAGATSGIGNVGTPETGNSVWAEADANTQDNNNWVIAAVAIASSSGDTLTAGLGTVRQSLIPALTTAGIALLDNTSEMVVLLRDQVRISSVRNWAAAALELRTGGTALDMKAPVLLTPAGKSTQKTVSPQSSNPPSTYNPVPGAEVLQGGIVGIAYSETITTQGGTSPYAYTVASGSIPVGTSLVSSTGVINGTPTTAATYTFVIQVTDANGFIGTQMFSITIANPTSGGNSGFVF